jgi:hypothetical protein
VSNEPQVYLEQTVWLLKQFSRALQECQPGLLIARPPGALERNNLLAIAKHATAVTRAYALGMGCGLDVQRDRTTEFIASAHEANGIAAALDRAIAEVENAFAVVRPADLDREFVPEQSLYGLGEPRTMSARGAIVENIRHLGIHLGELRLTRSLLEQGG